MPWLLILIPVGIAGWLLRPAIFTVRRSQSIAKDPDSIFAIVRDLTTWPKWSPWLICEPETKIEFHGDPNEIGGKYSWDGEVTGAGEIEHTGIEAPRRLEFEIRFTRPFKSKALVIFEFEPQGAKTLVTWDLEGRMPRVLHRMMKSVIGADYERGLAMLADVAQSGQVLSRLEFNGIVERPRLHWVGIERSCRISELGASMKEAFGALEAELTQQGILACGPWMSLYSKYDLAAGKCTYTAAAPIPQPIEIPGLLAGSQSSHRAFAVSHYGPYRHLGNPWAAAYQHLRATGTKAATNPAAYEIYVTSPGEVAESEIHTDIYVPVA